MLQNEYLIAKIGVDRAEDEARKGWSTEWAEVGDCGSTPRGPGARAEIRGSRGGTGDARGASFSAVSTPIFAIQNSFFSIVRDLQLA